MLGPTTDGPVLRVMDRTPLQDDVPTLLLDADADSTVLGQLFNPGPVCRRLLRPGAEAIQVHDHLFSKNSLKALGVRERIRHIVEAEVLRDRWAGQRGVLVVASKSVVGWFYEDINGPDARMPSGRVRMHGADWIWFGPGSRGLNTWEAFGTVIVIGREEPSLEGAKNLARAIFGDSAVPLNLIGGQQDARMPEILTQYLMADGSGAAASVAYVVVPLP